MDALELMAREHARLGRDLDRCLGAWESAQARGLECGVARRIGAYLEAEQQVLFPALISVSPRIARGPVDHHQMLKRRVADALAHCRRRDEVSARAICKLRQEMLRCAGRELTALRSDLSKLFTKGELRLLGGEMLLQLAGNRGAAAPTRLAPMARIRTIPTLHEIVRLA